MLESIHHYKQSLKAITKEATRRQLISYYRSDVNHLNEVTERYNAGADFHLGDPIHSVLFRAKSSLTITENELASRDIDTAKIKNVPALIAKKTRTELEADKALKAEQRAAAQLERDLTPSPDKALLMLWDAVNTGEALTPELRATIQRTIDVLR